MAVDPKYGKQLRDAIEQQPPLSRRDKWIYLALGLVSAFGTIGGLILAFLSTSLSAIIKPEAVWTAEGGKSLWGICGTLLTVFAGTIILERLGQRKPVTYKPSMVRCTIMMMVLGFVMFGMSLLGGTYLYADGTVKSMNVFGKETARYTPEQIERVFVDFRTGKSQTVLCLTLRTEDQKLLTFLYSDIPAEGKTQVLRDVLEDFSEVKTEFDGAWNLERFYRDFPCSEEDRAYLEWMFETGTGENYDGS